VKKCTQCEALIEDDAVFCGECGARQDIASPAAPEVAAPAGKCRTCNAEIAPGSAFCPECGAKQESPEPDAASAAKVVCASCGASLSAEAAFCPECGAKHTPAQTGSGRITTPRISTGESLQSSEADATEAYRDLVRQFSLDGSMDSAKSEKLKAKRTELHVSDEVARQIEAEVRQEMDQAGRPRGEYVKLEIDANKVLFRNRLGNIEFRLTNMTSRPIEGTRLKIACKSSETDVVRVPGRIQPNGERHVRLNIEPEKDGEDLLDIRLEYHPVGGRPQYLFGEAELSIFDRDEMRSDVSSNISIRIDAQNMTAVDMSKLVASDTAGKSSQEILDSMRARREPIWLRVDLYPDEERLAREEPGLGIHLIEPVADMLPQKAALLRVVSPADLPSSRMWVFSQPLISMGRQSDNAIRLLVEPVEDADNRRLSMGISSHHLELHYAEHGLSVVDLGSTNGTEVSGHAGRLPPNQPTAVDNGAVVSVAHVLDLRVDTAMRGEQDDLLLALRQFPSPWLSSPPSDQTRPFGLSGNGPHQWVRLRRSNPTGDEYMLLVCAALIGSGSECAWVLEHPSVLAHHARIVYHCERYWIHGMGQVGSTRVNGRGLGEREFAVLRAGMHVQLGEVDIEVTLPT